MKSLLTSKPVLWFLFLFNLTAAAAIPLLISGTRAITATVGMGIVSLQAGIGLLRQRAKRSDQPTAAAVGAARR